MHHINKGKVLVIGTGSIGCRHSLILSSFGYETIAASLRSPAPSPHDLDHQNAFSSVIEAQDLRADKFEFFVVANNTSLHTGTCSDLARLAPGRRVYCEKPGPQEIRNEVILYNLDYLPTLSRVSGKPVKLVHRANAKTWPSKMPWQERYIFRRRLGGGAILTHSHEINVIERFAPNSLLAPPEFCHTVFATDIDGESIDVEDRILIGGVELDLCLIEERNPSRYWLFEDHCILFYGDRPHQPNHDVSTVDKEQIHQSYVSMWEDLLSTQRTNKQPRENSAHMLWRKLAGD